MDANEMYDTSMLQLNDTDGSEEEQESFVFQEEADLAHIPPSLLSYFETSKSRAAVCEKLILEEFEDFPASHHAEDMMNLPFQLDKDMMKLNEQDEEHNTRLLPAPTEALFTHDVSMCPNSEDEAGTGEYLESEKHLALEYEAEREKQRCEEMKKEEQKRRIERDFQMALKKIMEAEKLHQQELELMGKRAQDKLEQELQLQQEVISSLKRRVEEERRRMDEEQKRMKDEEDKRKREEETFRIEAERKRMEEERRVKKEEEKKIEEMKLKHEEEEKRRKEREEKRKREEERNKIDLEKKKLEEEMRMRKEEEERKKREEIQRIKKEKEEKRKREKEREKIEEARKKMEKEKRDMAEEMRKKEEEERKKREEENVRIEEERRRTKEIEERKKQDEMRKKREEEALKKMHEQMRKEEEKDRKKREEEEKEEARKRERERQKMEEMEMVSKTEGENRTTKGGPRPIEEDEKRKKKDEWKTKEEEWGRRQQEEMRQEDEEGDRESEEDITPREDKEGYEGYDNMKMEHKSETEDKVKKQDEEKKLAKEEMRKGEERKNKEAEKELKEEEVGENKKENGIRLKQKEESKKRAVQSRDEEAGVVGELQEKRESDSTNKDTTEKTLASQLEHSTTSSPAPLHSESTGSPSSTETKAQQHHPEENIAQTSAGNTVDCEHQAARPSTVPVCLPVCLLEHTEKKRLSWMKDCVPWSKLSLQNRRKHKGSVRSRRGPRVPSSLPPLCPDSLLKSTGWKSLQEVTTVTLEDLPGCSLSTLAQCTQLRCLTLRRCGLKSLDGINQLPQLCYIDVQDNDISFINCENMTSLRVLQLGHNKLSSIHGLTGAENVDVLDLSYNSISRIAGLESVRRLQRLSVDHNQLISTKGLRDVYTLLHLNVSHNHLVTVEGLENSALLHTLDLRGNSLTEPPSLNNQVLLRELRLDDNSISSLQGLAACWLPLMQQLSVAQNRITQLPSMADCVSLANLDLRFNCMSELQNVCDSLEGCQFLREVLFTGNPLQQERGWRSTVQRAVPGLRAIDDQETDSFLTPPAVQQVSSASGSFLMFCQAQLQHTQDLQQRHSRELSKASSSLDAVKISCRHFTETLQLANDQRFAHEYGDTTVAAGRTTPEEALDTESNKAERRTESPEMESAEKVPLIVPNRDRCSSWTFEEKSAADSRHDTLDGAATGPKTGPTVSRADSGRVRSSATKGTRTSSSIELAAVSNHQDLQNTAAVVIQQLWRKYRQKSENTSSPSTAEEGGGRGGDGAEPESGPPYINRSLVGQDNAATVIQAFWRGFALRRRLASALAAVTCSDTGEDDTFEEVDVDEFIFDEAALEKHWTLSLCEDSPPRRHPVSHQPLSQKLPVHLPDPCENILPPPLVRRPKQAWVSGEQVDPAGQTESSNRDKSPASSSVLSGLSERSEKILEEWGFSDSHTALLMLKRAQKMKSTTKQQKKCRDPSIHLALFRNQLGPGEARHRPAQHNRSHIKVGEAEPGLRQAEKVERVKQDRAQQWLHTQAADHSDRDSESVRFLPEISPDILNGGRVQLVADPGYTERLHHASGLWANNSFAAQPRRESSYPRRNSLGHARKEVPSPQRVTSAPSKKERISHRDNPVQLSGGWGGGKKRDRV